MQNGKKLPDVSYVLGLLRSTDRYTNRRPGNVKRIRRRDGIVPPVWARRSDPVDAIAFRGIWSYRSLRQAAETWESVVTDFTEETDRPGGQARVRSERGGQFSWEPPKIEVKVAAFSDTIAVTARASEPRAPALLGLLQHISFPYFRAVDHGVFLRGAVSFGKFYRSDRIVLGPAIDEAVQWYDKADWFGVLLTPSATYPLSQPGTSDDNVRSILSEYEVPLSDTLPDGGHSYRTWVLMWPSIADEVYPIAIREEIRDDAALHALRREDQDLEVRLMQLLGELPTGPREVAKHRNTLDFYEWTRSR